MKIISAATTIAESVAFTLSGPCRLRADDLAGSDIVFVFEATVAGDFEQVRLPSGNPLRLRNCCNSIIFEGYGSYKALISRAGIVVGYDEGHNSS